MFSNIPWAVSRYNGLGQGQSYKTNFGLNFIKNVPIEENIGNQNYKQNLHPFQPQLHQNSDIKIWGKIFNIDVVFNTE